MGSKEVVLKSCPFCGSAMKIFKSKIFFLPLCVDDGCIAGDDPECYRSEEEAIKACNKRA